MAVNMDNVGAKYPATFYDADGDYLNGGRNFHVPKDVPVALFWSVTVYDPITASGLENGQPFPSINSMDRPVQNTDGTFDIYFGPKSPGEGNNWLATVPGKGWFTLFRLYGPNHTGLRNAASNSSRRASSAFSKARNFESTR
jgi:hypothetical protein